MLVAVHIVAWYNAISNSCKTPIKILQLFVQTLVAMRWPTSMHATLGFFLFQLAY